MEDSFTKCWQVEMSSRFRQMLTMFARFELATVLSCMFRLISRATSDSMAYRHKVTDTIFRDFSQKTAIIENFLRGVLFFDDLMRILHSHLFIVR